MKNILFLGVILLAACSVKPIKCDTQLVKVEVPVVDAPPVLVRPDLPINHVTTASDGGDVVKAYAGSVLVLQQYSTSLEAIIQHYAVEAATTHNQEKK